jgi:hypothetical protein
MSHLIALQSRLLDPSRLWLLNPGQASEEAEDRPQGCPTLTPADAGKQLSAILVTGSGESGSATAVVAPASLGADAPADHESTAGVGDERRLSLEEKLFSEQGRAQLEKLALAPWASRRRQELLELLDRMNPTIAELSAAVEREARKRPEVLRLMTHPGVGPLTALAFVLIMGTWERFPRGKQIGTYVGMIPSEDGVGTFV